MRQTVISKLTKNTVLLTLLDSKIPQSLIIKNIVLPKETDYVIVDTAVRNKLTNMRFMCLEVHERKSMWDSRKYFIPSEKILYFANNKLAANQKELNKSFLTRREISEIIQN
ncbi:MAG: hypothetical protein ACRCZW_05095 [Lactobacillaceae bacterium]